MTDTDTKTVDGMTETFETEDAPKPHIGWETMRFPAGLIVTEPSLIVDARGKPWWVDPRRRCCEPVEGTIPQTEQE